MTRFALTDLTVIDLSHRDLFVFRCQVRLTRCG
jgi:hypothetical protein